MLPHRPYLNKSSRTSGLQSYDQIYGQGIAKHSLLSAKFSLPAFGAQVSVPKTPSSLMHLPRYDRPVSIKEEYMYFALSPAQRVLFETLLREGNFEEAYQIWSKAAEAMLAFQLHSAALPKKCAGRGLEPSFKTQTLSAKGVHSLDAGAATIWRLRLSRLIRRCFELEARLTRFLRDSSTFSERDFAPAKQLYVTIIKSARELLPNWLEPGLLHHQLPTLAWVTKCREGAQTLERQTT